MQMVRGCFHGYRHAIHSYLVLLSPVSPESLGWYIDRRLLLGMSARHAVTNERESQFMEQSVVYKCLGLI